MAGKKHKRVLIAEDDADLRTLLEQAAVRAPFDVDIVSDGAEALQRYEDARQAGKPYSGLVLDVVLPRLSAYTVTQRIREQDRETRIGLFTAYVNDLWRTWGQGFDITAFWEKPVQPDHFYKSINDWLDGGRVNNG